MGDNMGKGPAACFLLAHVWVLTQVRQGVGGWLTFAGPLSQHISPGGFCGGSKPEPEPQGESCDQTTKAV